MSKTCLYFLKPEIMDNLFNLLTKLININFHVLFSICFTFATFEWGGKNTRYRSLKNSQSLYTQIYSYSFLVCLFIFYYGSFSPPYYKCHGYKYIEVLTKVRVGLLASLLWISYNHNILQLHTGCCS